jgi:hypothetical protein
MRRPFAVFTMCLGLTAPVLGGDLPRLKVSDNGRYLMTEAGKPFFYLGDTAWQLIHRLNREEVDLYFKNRAEKGFTVVQTVALSELEVLNSPNAYGHKPLIENDPARPDVKEGPENDYWDHVDYIVDRAASLGIYMGLLPTWGDKWQAARGGKGPVVFNPQNARAYGQWLGKRYASKPIIWILGGDRNIYNEADRAVIEAMANGLREGGDGQHLITYHPRGPGRSSDYFHHADWLDFNMYQSSHAARHHDNGLFARHDYLLDPAKPTLDGEPRYEGIPVGFYLSTSSDLIRFTDDDMREAAYWSLLAGACGHTYGNNNIWQIWSPSRGSVLGANVPWNEAMDHPGAFQMGYVRRLFESRPFHKLVPRQDLIVDGPVRGPQKIRAAMASDGSFAFIYSPQGNQFSIPLDAFQATQTDSAWYDPRYGVSYRLHSGDSRGIQTFVPPTSGPGQDWILVVDAADRKFPLPGPAR